MRKKTLWTLILLAGVYLATHIYRLTALPVFADEAIYIRWSQLIMDDWKRYLFFPLNDGKTPLQMWLMVPFQYWFRDQLFAGRFVSVLAGLIQVFVIGKITQILGGKQKTQWLSMALTIFLPFWFFHHRMALIEALLTLFISLSFLFTVQIVQKRQALNIFWAGLFFGFALLTKLTAILYLPVFGVVMLLLPKFQLRRESKKILALGIAVAVGMLIFLLLKLHPAFGQLFSRGGDFLFTPNEILSQGEWRQSLKNIPRFMIDIGHYLTWPVMFFSFAGLFFDKIRRKQIVLFLSAGSFLLPIMVMGQVVYPRYLMPSIIFFTVGAALAIQAVVEKYIYGQKDLMKKTLAALVVIQLLSMSLMNSLDFMAKAWTAPDELPLTAKDTQQYLTEWSSGHGILQTVSLIRKTQPSHSVLIATEGYFGTLPDAILMYLHQRDVTGIFVQGIGQPVRNIPQELQTQAADYDQVWLVVNSHRLLMDMSKAHLLAEYCRPDNAPCLQVWDITNQVPEK